MPGCTLTWIRQSVFWRRITPVSYTHLLYPCINEPEGYEIHTGDVYLNGKSFYEAGCLEDVKNPVMRTHGYNPPWTKHTEPILRPEDTIYQWYALSLIHI